jgi:oligosaccharide repeat unit polymerase
MQRLLSGGPLRVHAVAVDAHHRHFVTAVLAILSLSLAFQLGYLLSFGARSRKRITRLLGNASIRAESLLALVAILIVINLVGFTIMSGGPGGLYSLLFLGRTSDPIWQNEAMAGTALTPVDVLLTAIGVVAGVFGGYLGLSGRVRGWRRIIGVACWLVPITWAALVSGTRATLLLAVAPPILLVARERVRRSGGLRTGTIAILAAVLVILTASSNVIREFRAHATFAGDIDLELRDNDLFSNTGLAIAIAEREDLLFDSALLQIVALPIPRVVWRNKPASKAVPLFTRYVWGPTAYHKGKSNLPSIVGQYLLGWGWLGLLIAGLFLGVLMRTADDLVRHSHHNHIRLASLIFAMFVFISFRVLGNSGASVLYATVAFVTLARLRLRGVRRKAPRR